MTARRSTRYRHHPLLTRGGKRSSIAAVALALAALSGCKAERPDTAQASASTSASAGMVTKSGAPSPAPSGSGQGIVATSEHCQALCEKTTSLQCDTLQGCLEYCEVLRADTKCPHELGVFFECLLKQPAENFYCLGKRASISHGYCEDERATVSVCMMHRQNEEYERKQTALPSALPSGKAQEVPPRPQSK